MNKVVLVGNLTKDPKTGETKSGAKFTRFTVATNEYSKNGEITEFHSIVCWNTLAETCAKYLSKGRSVSLVGGIRSGKFTNDEGREVRTYEIRATEVNFLGSKRQSDQELEITGE